MAILREIKTANTPLKTVGDVNGIYEDGHRFSERELIAYNFRTIKGTAVEIREKLEGFRFRVERIFRTNTAPNQWSLDVEKAYSWQDREGTWYHLDAPPKYEWSTSLLDATDINILETIDSDLSKDLVLQKMAVNPGEWNVANNVEIKELNG